MPHLKLRHALCCFTLLGAFAPAAPAAGNARGDGEALTRAVELYERGAYPQAQAAFEALVRAGSPAAMHDLAVMHLHGEVPGASAEAARQLLLEAAERGFVTAQLALGELFESGRLGKADLVAALRWYQRAATAGSVEAQLAAGTAYLMGRGTAADSAEAAQWYRRAATGGDIGAQYILASLYEQGDDVAADKVKEMDARLASRDVTSAVKAPP